MNNPEQSIYANNQHFPTRQERHHPSRHRCHRLHDHEISWQDGRDGLNYLQQHRHEPTRQIWSCDPKERKLLNSRHGCPEPHLHDAVVFQAMHSILVVGLVIGCLKGWDGELDLCTPCMHIEYVVWQRWNQMNLQKNTTAIRCWC